MLNAQQVADSLYKSHYGKMVAAMLHFSRDVDLETAEDVVQDAFYNALNTWKEKGIPANPPGWIYQVCRNKTINILKRKETFTNPFENNETSEEITVTESVFDDEQLRLLFCCANPRLPAQVQVVITLKYVANLKVKSIAKALGLTVDGIDKLLVRARQKIKMENIFLNEPSAALIPSRLPVVHKIIYLIFNEGYKASSGNEIIRPDLCEESLMMSKALLDNRIGDKNTAALYALMLFHAARLNARFNATGELTDLEIQDRSLWNTDLIALGRHYLRQARGQQISSYHYEAAIAYLHAQATTFETTDWQKITQLYKQLLTTDSNPFIELNYAIGLYYSLDKQEAFSILHQLEKTFLSDYCLLHAALGKLYMLEGKHLKGEYYLSKAMTLTNFGIEKDFISRLNTKFLLKAR